MLFKYTNVYGSYEKDKEGKENLNIPIAPPFSSLFIIQMVPNFYWCFCDLQNKGQKDYMC